MTAVADSESVIIRHLNLFQHLDPESCCMLAIDAVNFSWP